VTLIARSPTTGRSRTTTRTLVVCCERASPLPILSNRTLARKRRRPLSPAKMASLGGGLSLDTHEAPSADSPSRQAVGVRSPLRASSPTTTPQRGTDTFIVSPFITQDEALRQSSSPTSQGTLPDESDEETVQPKDQASCPKSAPLEPMSSPSTPTLREGSRTVRAPEGLTDPPPAQDGTWASERTKGQLQRLQDEPSVVNWCPETDVSSPAGHLDHDLPLPNVCCVTPRVLEDAEGNVQVHADSLPPLTAPRGEETSFKVGVRARVRALVTFPEFNGRIGTIDKMLPGEAGEGEDGGEQRVLLRMDACRDQKRVSAEKQFLRSTPLRGIERPKHPVSVGADNANEPVQSLNIKVSNLEIIDGGSAGEHAGGGGGGFVNRRSEEVGHLAAEGAEAEDFEWRDGAVQMIKDVWNSPNAMR